MKRKSLGMGG